MIQKIVNGIAIASGVVSLTVVGLGGYVYIRKDAIIENVQGKVMDAVSSKLGNLGSLGKGSMDLPTPSTPSDPMSSVPLPF